MVLQQAHGRSILAFERAISLQRPIVINRCWKVTGIRFNQVVPWERNKTFCLGKTCAPEPFKFRYRTAMSQ